MSTIVLTDPVIQPDPVLQPVQRPEPQGHANTALRCVLDAEIEALKGRLLQRIANAPIACGLARVARDRQVGWLQDSMAKLQARRSALR